MNVFDLNQDRAINYLNNCWVLVDNEPALVRSVQITYRQRGEGLLIKKHLRAQVVIGGEIKEVSGFEDEIDEKNFNICSPNATFTTVKLNKKYYAILCQRKGVRQWKRGFSDRSHHVCHFTTGLIKTITIEEEEKEDQENIVKSIYFPVFFKQGYLNNIPDEVIKSFAISKNMAVCINEKGIKEVFYKECKIGRIVENEIQLYDDCINFLEVVMREKSDFKVSEKNRGEVKCAV